MPSAPPYLWRISNHLTLSGEGGLRYAARWHSAGRPIVYLAESPAGALLEVLVHLELQQDELPANYTLLHISVSSKLPVEDIPVPSGEAWKTDHTLTRALGDEWLSRNAGALARVPSAILPDTFNYLLNPLHPDSRLLQISGTTRTHFDPRLLKHLR